MEGTAPFPPPSVLSSAILSFFPQSHESPPGIPSVPFPLPGLFRPQNSSPPGREKGFPQSKRRFSKPPIESRTVMEYFSSEMKGFSKIFFKKLLCQASVKMSY